MANQARELAEAVRKWDDGHYDRETSVETYRHMGTVVREMIAEILAEPTREPSETVFPSIAAFVTVGDDGPIHVFEDIEDAIAFAFAETGRYIYGAEKWEWHRANDSDWPVERAQIEARMRDRGAQDGELRQIDPRQASEARQLQEEINGD